MEKIINQIADQAIEDMGHSPFQKKDFKLATHYVLEDELGKNYLDDYAKSDLADWDASIYYLADQVVNLLIEHI